MKVGETFETKSSGLVKVLEVGDKTSVNNRKALVEFVNTGGRLWTTTSSVSLGDVWDRNLPRVHGVGVFGYGKYEFHKDRLSYNKWSAMLERSCSEEFKSKNKDYEDCTVDARWLNFQNFTEDFYQMHGWDKDGWQLDKDVLVYQNRTYSPETCCLLPQEINCITLRRRAKDRDLPRGVEQFGKRYGVRDRSSGNTVWLIKTYDLDEAIEVYQLHKVRKIQELAIKWQGELSPQVYDALMNYKVD